MKKIGFAFLMVPVFFGLAFQVLATDDIKKHSACKYCGMDREKFAHSRMVVEYTDGTVVGTCSLHCTALDLAVNIDKSPKFIGVADLKTKKLIDAEKAFWIIGGNKPGVMTKRAKWAFVQKEEAETFIRENQGTPADFDGALKAAYNDIADDTKMIRERRRPMGHDHKMMEKK